MKIVNQSTMAHGKGKPTMPLQKEHVCSSLM